MMIEVEVGLSKRSIVDRDDIQADQDEGELMTSYILVANT